MLASVNNEPAVPKSYQLKLVFCMQFQGIFVRIYNKRNLSFNSQGGGANGVNLRKIGNGYKLIFRNKGISATFADIYKKLKLTLSKEKTCH